jgi:putative ABC transport system substrate-binding protein
VLRDGLAALGYVEGRNLVIEVRYADGDRSRANALARELVERGVELLVAYPTLAAHAARDATRTLPIVVITGDPQATGLVSNLRRPGGNVTGVSAIVSDLAAKRLELLREVIPGIDRVAFLGSATDPLSPVFVRETQQAADALGLTFSPLLVSGSSEFAAAFAQMEAAAIKAVIVQGLFVDHRVDIAALGIRHRLPVISGFAAFAAAGALFSYDVSRTEIVLRAAAYVDRILTGTPPGDLPIAQPTRFELLINIRTARALGIAIPPAVLVRADEVIE